MTAPEMARFCTALRRHNQVNDLRDEALRHEMMATLNRNQLTHQDEGGFSFNITQLSWIVSGNPGWTYEHFLVRSLLLSALIEERLDIFRDAQDCGVIPASWTWVAWADGFAGDEAKLLAQLALIADPKQRCGVACLATRLRPQAIGARLLDEFRLTSLATVYHRLLGRALQTPQARSFAAHELEALGDRLEVLFSADTDSVIAALVTASDLAQPELAVAGLKDACGDFTATAIARRHLERGRARQALDLVKDLRFLSPAFDQAIVVAALAALECGDFALSQSYTSNVKDEQTRLRILTRLAQACGDAQTELTSLVTLATLNPKDAQVFVQLIALLDRTKHNDLARQVCFQAQERFVNDPLVDELIRRHIA
jgi:hypothetical protein